MNDSKECPEDHPSPAEELLNKRWLWLLDIIFGGIVILAIDRLVTLVGQLSELSDAEPLLVLLGTATVMIFFIYDVTVLQFLYLNYPFRQSLLSAVRLFLDILMATVLALIMLPVIIPRPQEATATLLITVSCWHLLAICWHLLATHEKSPQSPPPAQVLVHLLNPALLWGVVLAGTLWQDRPLALAEFNRAEFFIPCCLILMTYSIVRGKTAVRNLAAAWAGRRPTKA